MLGSKIKKSETGFTLMEILVVLSIFAVLVLLLVNVFLLTLRSQRQASSRQDTVASLRFVMESLAQNIRASEIDYRQLPLDTQVLRLRSGANTFVYSLNSGEIMLTVNGQPSLLTNASKAIVFKLNFFVNPKTNPFTEQRCNADSDCSSNLGCTVHDQTNEFKSGYCRCAVATEQTDCPLIQRCVADTTGQNLCLPFDNQPRVTIILGFKTAGPRLEDQRAVYLQTTVSSRIYKR